MRRQRDDMQVNVAGLRRNIKNLAHNYSDAQVKVREATSNDPWGPSSTLMAEIADLTYNVVAFTEIMQMIWKRLNDHGRNWRHVYKALVLLEYLIKTGTEKVAQQCKENIFAIQTLKDFQYLEEGKDQGVNVREKAKQLVILLKDDERLRNERARALKAKERFAQTPNAFGSDGAIDTAVSPNHRDFRSEWSSSSCSDTASREMDAARPQTVGEEELQLQLALAMSREEAEQEEQRRRSDDVRLQLALSQSQQDFKVTPLEQRPVPQSHMLDLLDVSLGEPPASNSNIIDPWGLPPPTRPQTLDFGYYEYNMNQSADPWSTTTGSISPPPLDPWAPAAAAPPVPAEPWATLPPKKDPWAPGVAASNLTSPVTPIGFQPNISPPHTAARPSPLGAPLNSPPDLSEFDIISNRSRPIENLNNNNNGGTLSPDPFDLTHLNDTLTTNNSGISTGATKKTPQSFLGENSSLVNLDNLIKPTPVSQTMAVPFGSPVNPFSEPALPPRTNLFQQQMQQQVRPSMNQIKQPPFLMPQPVQDPWAPVANSNNSAAASPWTSKPLDQPNPFLS